MTCNSNMARHVRDTMASISLAQPWRFFAMQESNQPIVSIVMCFCCLCSFISAMCLPLKPLSLQVVY
jgi:hypothetical protein